MCSHILLHRFRCVDSKDCTAFGLLAVHLVTLFEQDLGPGVAHLCDDLGDVLFADRASRFEAAEVVRVVRVVPDEVGGTVSADGMRTRLEYKPLGTLLVALVAVQHLVALDAAPRQALGARDRVHVTDALLEEGVGPTLRFLHDDVGALDAEWARRIFAAKVMPVVVLVPDEVRNAGRTGAMATIREVESLVASLLALVAREHVELRVDLVHVRTYAALPGHVDIDLGLKF